MKILSVVQIREADQYTIQHEPIASIDLMERASRAFTNWFIKNYSVEKKITIFCGMGNNGGDGLAVARMLHQASYEVETYVVKHSDKSAPDFDLNLKRLQEQSSVIFLENIPQSIEGEVIIDAILGSGLSRATEGLIKEIITFVNNLGKEIVSIDMPSGLFADSPNKVEDTIIKAHHTVSFQLPKLAFMLPQNEQFVGNWHLVDIGLHVDFIKKTETKYYFTDTQSIEKITKPRPRFSHKGTFGFGLLIAGSYGMMGAAILASKAAMRAGIGKLLVHIPSCGDEIMQISIPEAMISVDFDKEFHQKTWHKSEFDSFSAVGIGPGIGVHGNIAKSIESIIDNCREKPLLIDADGLNNLATKKGRDILKKLPPNTILTPHPKEFERLIGAKTWQNDYERLQILSDFAVKYQIIVCLKGANTAIALPDGTIYFNSTGNAGMATAGSGDVLTGIILSFLAQGYTPHEAAILGVYEHGMAGDRATQKRSMRSVIASDIIEEIR